MTAQGNALSSEPVLNSAPCRGAAEAPKSHLQLCICIAICIALSITTPASVAAQEEAKAKAADAKAKAEALKAERAKEQEEALNAQAQQYIQLLQPTMWTELDFVRQNCDLKPEQRPKIKAAAEAAVKQAARDIGNPRLVAGAARIQRTQTGAAITIRNEVAKALKEVVSAEEFARYSKEATARAAHRKEASILSVVSRLDALLCLSASQRDKMVESLAAGWQEDWEQWLQLQNYGGQYFPQIPDKHILSLLNAEQKSVWSGVQKINASSWSGNNGQARDTAWWEGKNE